MTLRFATALSLLPVRRQTGSWLKLSETDQTAPMLPFNTWSHSVEGLTFPASSVRYLPASPKISLSRPRDYPYNEFIKG